MINADDLFHSILISKHWCVGDMKKYGKHLSMMEIYQTKPDDLSLSTVHFNFTDERLATVYLGDVKQRELFRMRRKEDYQAMRELMKILEPAFNSDNVKVE